jgi:phosphohistidine phosphatase
MTQKTKTIFLLRHGKSGWDHPELDDIKRELLPKGIHRTEQIANYLKDINIKIDQIYTSPARRALDTAKIIKQLMHLPNLEVVQNLYPGDAEAFFNLIISLNDQINHVMIVGHNPGITYFAQQFMNAEIDNLPTSGLISCKYFTPSWSEFTMCDKKLNFVVFPKNL